MLISQKWLKEFVDFDYSPSELDSILTMLGIEVEGITDYSEKYKNFFTGVVLTKEKHPNADKLSLCTVDFGKGVKQIICGAPNVRAGLKVVVANIGAIVPNGGFRVEKRPVRKIESEGMLCSQTELELGEESQGIWELPDDTPIGVSLAEHLGLEDIVYEISVTPNRADCLSHLGIAREIAAYANKPIKLPDTSFIENTSSSSDFISVEILDAEKCPRYTARIIHNTHVTESPLWLKQRLRLCGQRPVNVIVDVTNYVLLECGQPLHAFDLSKISGNKIICKSTDVHQKFITLDGKERIIDSSMLLICDAEKPLAIGGVMGGANSEITDATQHILLESAYFQPSSIRRTSKKLGLQSESSYRFERGVDFNNIVYASDRAAKLIAEITGATVESSIVDIYPNPIPSKTVSLRYSRIADILGVHLSIEQIKNILTALQFLILDENTDSITVQVPSYRVDIELEIDLIEEIARLYNYDNITPNMKTTIDASTSTLDKKLSVPPIRKEIRNYLVANGFHEILTQNQTDPANANIFTDNPVTIQNPLGEELSVMRPSLFPALLKTIEHNNRLGNFDLRLFEIGKTFHVANENKESFINGISEKESLIIAISGNNKPMNWDDKPKPVDFYDIKGIAENLLGAIKIRRLKFIPLLMPHPIYSPNTLEIFSVSNSFGFVGEVSTKILNHFDLQKKVFALEIDLDKLYNLESGTWKYEKVSPFPGTSRDLAFIINDSFTAEEIRQEIVKHAGNLARSVNIFDVFKGKNFEPGKKSIAFSIYYSSPDRTLTDKEVDNSINEIIAHIEKTFDATLRKA